LLTACGSSPPPKPLDHPVWQLARIDGPAAAWAAAAQADQPLLIIGQAAYGLSPACVPQRYFSERDAPRQLGAQADQRLLGSGMDDRRLGSAADTRQLGSAADARQLGSAADARQTGAQADRRLQGSATGGRNLGAASDQRLTGAAQDQRNFGGDARGRHFGAESVRRAFGAVESTLRCRLAGATLVVTGTGARDGYLYSPRLRGALDGVLLR
jgi:hypothetical protein